MEPILFAEMSSNALSVTTLPKPLHPFFGPRMVVDNSPLTREDNGIHQMGEAPNILDALPQSASVQGVNPDEEPKNSPLIQKRKRGRPRRGAEEERHAKKQHIPSTNSAEFLLKLRSSLPIQNMEYVSACNTPNLTTVVPETSQWHHPRSSRLDATTQDNNRSQFKDQTGLQGPLLSEASDPSAPLNPARSVLHLNSKTGTLEPLPVAKAEDASIPLKDPSIGQRQKHGWDESSRRQIGARLEQALNGNSRPDRLPLHPGTEKDSEEPMDELVDRSLAHPFFNRKPIKKANGPAPSEDYSKPTPASRICIRSATPCGITRPISRAFAVSHEGTTFAILKVPGAQYPPWPSKGTLHIRGAPDYQFPSSILDSPVCNARCRKSKGQTVCISGDESVLRGFSRKLRIRELHQQFDTNPVMFSCASGTLRVPQRLFESGRKLRSRILPELRTFGPVAGDASSRFESQCHPAIGRLFDSLERNLSCFDKSDCEDHSWPHKYSPNSAAEVLQDKRECQLIKAWLEALKVNIVDTGGGEPPASKSCKAPLKKRKKKLDGFVLSSDEEIDDLDELSNDKDLFEATIKIQSITISKKTVVRNGDLPTGGMKAYGRPKNAILISGPHGCGKTAAVYAIAKELEYEVFEINPSCRRSGRDILERVGDMTRNHLVQHHRRAETPQSDLEPDTAVSSLDPESEPKQQTPVLSFFKPKVIGKAPKAKLVSRVMSGGPTYGTSKKSVAREQKQSLILLEEVDVLFEEDKQFWATLFGLMAQSKRPFIMTCTDENLVPLQALCLHGIFRFSPVPADLAVDLLLLVAANEGHSLRRSAVESLYGSRSQDLRASIAELNYWCQIGVGDQRGGFDWFYSRWPRGSDLDESGDVIRVVSDETYQGDMNWFSSSMGCHSPEFDDAGNDVARHGRETWQIDVLATHDLPVTTWATTSSIAYPRSSLDAFEDFTSFVSAADICEGGALGFGLQELLDPAQPGLSSKTREDYVVGLQLLDTMPAKHYCTLPLDFATYSKLAARRALLGTHTEGIGSLSSSSGGSSRQIGESTASDLPRDPFAIPWTRGKLGRHDLSLAFDPIAVSEKAGWHASTGTFLDPSIFDRTTRTIVVEVAPYVRGIVAHDQDLFEARVRRSNMLSEGGRPPKKMRHTRSAFSALEGKPRNTTRRRSYFAPTLNPHLVTRTGGRDWIALVKRDVEMQTVPDSVDGVVSAHGSP